MHDRHWNQLLATIRGEAVSPPPIGFIIDSPWLPNWFGVSIAEYLSSETLWFEANRKAVETFPEAMFLPGFWSEFGMCTEPSAFGSRCVFPPNEFPFAEKIIHTEVQMGEVKEPNPATDGLLPFMLNRLKWARPHIEDLGHKIRFSVSRGPLNVATFLMGTTEFLMALKTEPELTHQLLRTITSFLKKWHALQRETISTIDGILMLDDIVGFMSERDFLQFGFPYLKEIYAADVAVKFFHNDAPCAASVKHYAEAGIQLYNPGIQSSLGDIRKLSANRLTILGTVPPRDVLAQGTPAEVREAVQRLLAENPDHSRLILSCAGGVPPGVSTANLKASIEATRG